jgi:hypothetical protein
VMLKNPEIVLVQPVSRIGLGERLALATDLKAISKYGASGDCKPHPANLSIEG